MYSQFMMHGQRNIKLGISLFHHAFFNSIMDKTPTHALLLNTLD